MSIYYEYAYPASGVGAIVSYVQIDISQVKLIEHIFINVPH